MFLSDTFERQPDGMAPCCTRNGSLQPLLDPDSDHKLMFLCPKMKNSNYRTAGWGNECTCVPIRSLALLHHSSASLKRSTVVATWKLLFSPWQYRSDSGLWLGDLQRALLQHLEAEANGTAALLGNAGR